MCLVLFAYDPQSSRPLVVAANRDEFYARPARSAHFWDDTPALLAGRDLTAGGTWLGVSRTGRFATVTNFAEEGPSEAPHSRGRLPQDFLTGSDSARTFSQQLHGLEFRGFNLLLWDTQELVYTSNRGHSQTLAAGVYGLANAELGARWPKVLRGSRALAAALTGEPDINVLLDVLADRSVPADAELPHRGRPLELERRVAPCFISGSDYGTRASTVVVIERSERGTEGRIRFVEQLYGPGGAPGERATFEVALGEPSV